MFDLELMVAGKTPIKISHHQPTPVSLFGLVKPSVPLLVQVHPEKPK
jgi:hypothetical protein